MDSAWFEDFLAIVEESGFRRAAERRAVSQPAFSRRIKALEDWVGASLFDPTPQTHGLQELMARIAQSQQRFAGAYFKNDSFSEHHDHGLFRWTMYDRDGQAFVRGTSFGRFGDDGRLVQATGFFEAPSKKA